MPPKNSPVKKRAAALDTYRRKRNFSDTAEPRAKKAMGEGRSFVVQEHHARSHHFDLRLEMDGVLVSWAVPKGLPEDEAAKRLAVHVEDHPLDYGSFEGTIPKGNYGAGTVAIWDRGTWEPLEQNWRRGFDKGKMKFLLHGDRLHGIYLLARMKEEPNWLLRKLDDAIPPDRTPPSPREEAAFVAPQLARVTSSVPSGKEWWHELKFDGYRLIAVKKGGKVTLYTRSKLDWTDRFGDLADHLAALTKHDFVLDGEAVVFDIKGRSRFGDLQAALKPGHEERIAFVAFDLLHLDGRNLRALPLSQRFDELTKLVGEESVRLRLSKVWSASEGADLFRQACANGLEGIISKRSVGRYLEGTRRDWLKSKCRARQEFVICGYTAPKGSLRGFGALLLASFENEKLIPRGKVGTGFSDRERLRLVERFKPIVTKKTTLPEAESGVTWLRPELVAEVEFAELTREGSIRQGSFVALREDQSAAEVHLDAIVTTRTRENPMKVAGITISHPDRVVYPADGITKMEVARFYERVADYMLPHLMNRPLALLRAPSGISGNMFFQKSFRNHLPDQVTQKKLTDGTTIFYLRNTRGLISLAQFGAIEFHPWGSRMPHPEKPDQLIWDLDPDPAVPWPQVLGAAFLIRDLLAEQGLHALVKTSGGKGLHLLLFIKRTHDWDSMREFTKAVAREVAAFNPSRLVITSSKAKRKGKIFIDWMRNGEGSTCIAPWSLRARDRAGVSMPVNWSDLATTTADGFTIHEPLKPPVEWIEPEPQLIPKALLRRLAGKKMSSGGR
jgi:bifunctional non-homologous end joining protein LigD